MCRVRHRGRAMKPAGRFASGASRHVTVGHMKILDAEAMSSAARAVVQYSVVQCECAGKLLCSGGTARHVDGTKSVFKVKY